MTRRAALLSPILAFALAAPALAQWLPTANNLYFNTGNVSIGTNFTPYPLYVIGGGQAVIVAATSTPTGVSIGLWGQSSSTNGRGVYGYATSATGPSYGGLFRCLSSQGVGVYGLADSATGTTVGLRGQAASPDGTGLFGVATSATGETTGVLGKVSSATGIGVWGAATSTSGVNYGVYGETASMTDGYGVYCIGDTAATGVKLFQIDHPLDPANRLLNHFSEEGPEPYLTYRGTAIIDSTGFATVQLPEYFAAINRDPHYQLTPIGAPAVLYIAQEVTDNHFTIGGGRPGMKVCWTVTGIRNDAFVRRYGAVKEVVKSGKDRGRYLQPELVGLPHDRALRPGQPSLDSAGIP